MQTIKHLKVFRFSRKEQRDLIAEFIGILFSALQSSMKIIIQVISKQKQTNKTPQYL